MVNINPTSFWDNAGKMPNARRSFLQRDSETKYWESGEIDANYMLDKGISFKTAMEYGSGDGRIAKFIAPLCEKFYCVDIAQSVLDLVKEQMDIAGIENVEYLLATEIRDTEFVDFVYSFQVVQHNPLQEQYAIFQRIYNVLRKDGTACIHLAAMESKPGYVNSNTCMCFTKQQAFELANFVNWEYTIDTYPMASNVGIVNDYDYFVWAKKTDRRR